MKTAIIRSQFRSLRTVSASAPRALRIPLTAGRPATRLYATKSPFSSLPLARAGLPLALRTFGNKRYASIAAAAQAYVVS